MADERSLLERQIDAAPNAPGCYLFRDDAGTVLYVGKAIDIHKRVRSYLRPGNDGRAHIYFLMERATQVEFVVTANEKEALILENNLIKRFRPRYNIVLAADDATYVSVRMDLRHPYPRATIVHKYKRDGATYFGPFASSDKLRETMDTLKRAFPLRLCSDHVLGNRTRPCVYHDIGICCAPCVPGRISTDDYRRHVDGLIDVLKGRDKSLLTRIEAEMNQAAGNLEFEKAARLRDRMRAVAATVTRQRATVGDDRTADRDVIGLYREADRALISLLVYREGQLIDTSSREIKSLLPDEELLAGFIEAWYQQAAFIPDEVLTPLELEGAEALSSWLSDKAEHRVRLLTPRQGDKRKLVELAQTNARHALKVRDETQQRERELLKQLQEAAGLENLPVVMECYDISHTQGQETVASGVCFVEGKPEKSLYRKYKVKSHDRNDDFASMEEILRRRLERARKEERYPDLIVIDGGAGQLGRVQKVFEEFNIVGIDLIGLAKSRDKGEPGWESGYSARRQRSDERIFVPGRLEPITLDQRSPALFLLMRIRDEAHRFAVTFHRELARKAAVASGLDSIDGIGPKRKKALIKRFGSPRGVKLAGLEELASVEGISRQVAQRIFEHFTQERAEIVAREAARTEAAQEELPATGEAPPIGH